MECNNRRPIFHLVFCSVLASGRWAAAWLFRNRLALGIASLVWLVVRSGSQPRRLSYPCQRAAAANISALAVAAAAGMAMPAGFWRRLAARRSFRVAAVACVVGVAGWLTLPPLFQAEIPAALVAQQQLADQEQYDSAALSPVQILPDGRQAIVSVARDPQVEYAARNPFDKTDNAAYALVWRAVAQLRLGPEDNPLEKLIRPGERVVIKPNLEGGAPLQHTRPCVVRPIVDMAMAAGAAEVIIAESCPVLSTAKTLKATGYVDMVDELNRRGLPCKLGVVNLDETPWSWVNLGEASVYPPGRFTDADLVSSRSKTYHQAKDSHGCSVGGKVLGNHALYDLLFDADVVINVPRLKIHGMMLNTLALKNLVGITVSSPSGDDRSENFARIAHHGTGNGPDHMIKGFGNDIAWREMTNINRALVYWKNGKMHDTPQRKLLCVLDAIACGDGSHGNGPLVPVGAILAGVDPIAIDAVGSRLMRYDYRAIPLIYNATTAPSHALGTHDPASIALVGDPIGSDISFQFCNVYDKFDEFEKVKVADIEPPAPAEPAVAAHGDDLTITVAAPDTCTVILHYQQQDAGPAIMRMARDGDTFTAKLPNFAMEYFISAHDRHFNSTGDTQLRTYQPAR